MKQLRLSLAASLCMGAVLLCALLSHVAVPLYDGVGFPDEPYRYTAPPGKTARTPKKPGTAQTTVLLTGSTNANDLTVSTRESGPQMLLYFPARSVTADADSVRITGTPYAPTKNQPAPKGTLTGNYYRVSFTAAQGAARFTKPADAVAYIQLRLPQGFPIGATILYRTAAVSPWRALHTVRTGSDIYQASFTGPGDYVLSSTPSRAAASHLSAVIAGASVAVLGVATLLIVIRRRSKQSTAPRAANH